MNGIITLCHFCENHGPSIMFCTQVFHSDTPLQAASLLDASIDTPVNTPTTEGASRKLDSVGVDDQNKSGISKSYSESISSQQGESLVSVSLSDRLEACSLETNEPTNTGLIKMEVKCEACRSLPPGVSGYVSNDVDAGVTYISSQHPRHQEVFSMVRQACVKSLSSEVSPGREGPGPIFYGDDTSGYVLSHTFIIKDSQYSRGFQRRYSIMVVMMDKIFLLNSWPFLVGHLKDIIDELQAKALKVYESEQARNPARSQRLAHPHHIHFRAMTMAPSKPARSLVDLTGDAQIFRKLHQTFTWLLKAGGNRLTEKLLEGPPTEDTIIDVEKQEETEEGFVLLSSMRDVIEETPNDTVSMDATQIEEEDSPVFVNLRHLLKMLGYRQFHQVALHVVIGNQVIITGNQKKLIKSIIDCLKVLLPKGCCKVIYYSTNYEDAWKCNFLGLSPTAKLPPHIEHYVLLSVHHTNNQSGTDVEDALASLDHGDFNGYTFTVQSPAQLPEKGPAILSKMEYALMNDNLADSVVDQYLVCVKEEWMNKVKVLFKFTKAGGSRSDDDTRELLRIVGAMPEDKVVLQFWRTGLSAQYRHHMLSSAINTS